MKIIFDGDGDVHSCPFNWDNFLCKILESPENDCPDRKAEGIPAYCPLRKGPVIVSLDYKGYECTICGNFIPPDEVGDFSVCPVCHSTKEAEGGEDILVPAWKFAGKI